MSIKTDLKMTAIARQHSTLARKKNVPNSPVSKAVLVIALSILAVGCTTTKSIDLAAERQEKMQEDMALWKQTQLPVPEKGITLNEAINLGLTNNLELRAAAFERAMLDDNVLAEQLNMLPDLNASFTRDRRDSLDRQDFLRDDTGEITQSNVISSFRTNSRSQIELTWSVLDFGLSYVRSRQAGYESIAAQIRSTRQGQLLALEITDAFWRAALAEDALDYLRSTEADLRSRKGQIDNAVSEGYADPIVAKSTARRLVDVELAIRDLQGAVSSARIDLARLTGLPLGQEFRLIREPMRPILSNLPRLPQIDADALVHYALLNRPELFEADVNQRIKTDDAKAALLSMFPDLTFGFGQFYNNNRLLRNNEWNRASASVSWNLLQIPSRYASYKGRKNGIEMARFQRLQTTAGVISQVHLALLDYAVKIDRFMLRDEASKLSTDLLELLRGNLAAGEATPLQVTERQLDELTTRMARDQSVVDVLVAYTRLLTSVGVDTKLWRHQLTAVCLPLDERNGSCLAKAGQYTPLVQTGQSGKSGYDDLSVVKVEVIRRPTITEAPFARPEMTVPPVSLPSLTIPAEPQVVGLSQVDNSRWPTAEVVTTDIAPEPNAVKTSPSYADTSGGKKWVVFVGAYNAPNSLAASVEMANTASPTHFDRSNAVYQNLPVGASAKYRVGFDLSNQQRAKQACEALKSRKMSCWVALTDKTSPATL